MTVPMNGPLEGKEDRNDSLRESVTREEVIRFYAGYDLRKKRGVHSRTTSTIGRGMIRPASTESCVRMGSSAASWQHTGRGGLRGSDSRTS